MQESDYWGFTACFCFGLWFLLFPRSVIRFYSSLFGSKMQKMSLIGTRVAGGLWIVLMLVVLISFLMKR
jgi:hypothetical protein